MKEHRWTTDDEELGECPCATCGCTILFCQDCDSTKCPCIEGEVDLLCDERYGGVPA